MSNESYGLPGAKAARAATHKRVLVREEGKITLPKGLIVIDAGLSRDPTNTGALHTLQPGVLLGKITTGGKYRPSIIGVLTVAYDKDGSDKTSMTVAAATAVELNRLTGGSGTFILTGPATAGGQVVTETITFSAINTTTGVITVTAGTSDHVVGSFLQPTDGAATPVCVIGDGWGIKVTDQDEADTSDVPLQNGLVGGVIDSSQIVNWPSDAGLILWVMTVLNGGAVATASAPKPAYGPFIFDHRY
jgi:hypothetical protein